jgi:hypothetical protein
MEDRMNLQMLRSHRLGALNALVVVAVAMVGVVSLAPTPKAHATTDRRLCKYVWMQGVGNTEGRTVSFVMNYKKDGDCPNINPGKVRLPTEVGTYMPSPGSWYRAPVPKMTCEEFQAAELLPWAGDGSDVCTTMWESELYAVTSPLNGVWSDKDRFYGLGNAWALVY